MGNQAESEHRGNAPEEKANAKPVGELAALVERLEDLAGRFGCRGGHEMSVGTISLPIERTAPEEEQSSCGSSMVAEAGDIIGDPAATGLVGITGTERCRDAGYLDPVTPVTKEGGRQDEKKMVMLPEIEDTLCTQESNDRESLSKTGLSPTGDASEHKSTEEVNHGAVPHLRGGAPPERRREDQSNPRHRYSYNQETTSLGDHCGFYGTASEKEDHVLEHLQAWIEHARILQLQNTSYSRMIDHLQEILEDAEGTVEWQNQELIHAYRCIEELEHQVHEARNETLVARREAQVAKAEAQRLQDQLLLINEQVVEFCAELDEKEQQILALHPEVAERYAAEMRGGGGSRRVTIEPSPAKNPETPEPSTQDVDATAFFFFPSVSILVLLTHPLRYFQYPKNTTLAQIRQILKDRYTEENENSPYVRQIREIFEIRDEAGIPLPDTSDQRQVLISIPETKYDSDSSGEKPGRKGMSKWDKTFLPNEYVYEHTLKESIESLNIPVASDRSPLSPPTSAEDETFYDAGDLVNKIEREAEASRARSEHFVPPISGEIPDERTLNVRWGFLDTLALPPSALTSSNVPQSPHIPVRRTQIIAPERPTTPHPVCMSKTKAWNVLHYPPKEDEPDYESVSELDRSANFDYELGVGSGRASPSGYMSAGYASGNEAFSSSVFNKEQDECKTFKDEDKYKEDPEMLRHKRGEGCETWIHPSKLEALRDRCMFCHVPFMQTSRKEQTIEDDSSFNHDLKGKTHITRSTRNSPKSSGGNSAEAVSPTTESNTAQPYLRGGAEEVEWARLPRGPNILRGPRLFQPFSSWYWPPALSLGRPLTPRKHVLQRRAYNETLSPMYALPKQTYEHRTTQKRVRFTPSEKRLNNAPVMRGGHIPSPTTPVHKGAHGHRRQSKRGNATPPSNDKECIRDRLIALSREIESAGGLERPTRFLIAELASLRAHVATVKKEIASSTTNAVSEKI